MRVLLASTNPHKVAEFRRLFADSPLRLVTADELGVPVLDVPERGRTFAENAIAKACAYQQAYSMPALADDSGLCVDALAGAPGVRSARFGLPTLDDAGRMQYLLECMRSIDAGHRTAHYMCSLVLAQPDAPLVLEEGACYGILAQQPGPGTTGFGYDPIFLVPSFGCTISMLTPEQKDRLSHRGRAARRLLAHLHMLRDE